MKPRIKSLLQQIHSGKMKTDMARVLNSIKTYPNSTLPEIKLRLCLKHETASARISGLLDLGLIEEKGEVKTKSGVHTSFFFQSDLLLQRKNAYNRDREKFRNWQKQGLTRFESYLKPELKQLLTE